MKVKEFRHKKNIYRIFLLITLLFCTGVSGCGSGKDSDSKPEKSSETVKSTEDSGEGNGEKRDNTPRVLKISTDRSEIYEGADTVIDASSASEGYVTVSYNGTAGKVRTLIKCPNGETYNFLTNTGGEDNVYPLTEGSGTYNVGVYENIEADQYAMLISEDISVNISDEKRVFLYPNKYVDFDDSTKAVKKAEELAGGAKDDLDVVELVYHYVTENISYDYDKAETVPADYVPDVDDTLDSGKGICFDYSSLMATMLRTQGIPTRLEVGYSGDVYHAWISVYIEEIGWIDDIIEFDGKDWVLMDPTLASYAEDSTIEEYMENSDKYYTIKYKY